MKYRDDYLIAILEKLLRENNTDYVAFSNTKINSDIIGKYVSALANQAALYLKPYAYALFGLNHETKEIVGTDYTSQDSVISFLSTNAIFSIQKFEYKGKQIVLLEVQKATETTVQYKGIEYILDKSIPVMLQEENKKIILENLSSICEYLDFPANKNVSLENVFKLLDCEIFFKLLGINFPKSALDIARIFLDCHFLKSQNTGKYTITNLGAILLARKLDDFVDLKSRAIHVIKNSNLEKPNNVIVEIGNKGYLVGLEGLLGYIMEYRKDRVQCSEEQYKLAVKELILNAMIHQDFKITGEGPVISIFPNRIEITNTGKPLVDSKRFIDSLPVFRNEFYVSIMQKIGVCKGQGKGYDNVISFVEKYNLPAPQIEVKNNLTKVILFDKKNFNELTDYEKILICYNHTCINYLQAKVTNNNSLRIRLQLEESEQAKVSEIFEESKDYVKPIVDGESINEEYVPFWA